MYSKNKLKSLQGYMNITMRGNRAWFYPYAAIEKQIPRYYQRKFHYETLRGKNSVSLISTKCNQIN